MYSVGDLHLSTRNSPWNVALFDAVKSDGFIEGQNRVGHLFVGGVLPFRV